jgi:DNA-directed RNA polymerase specialized sigma24 family protein
VALWAQETLVLPDRTSIPADDYFAYILEKTWLKVITRFNNPGSKTLRKLAREKAIDFYRLAENAPLGLAGLAHRRAGADGLRIVRDGERHPSGEGDDDELFDNAGRCEMLSNDSANDPEFIARAWEACRMLTARQLLVIWGLYAGYSLRELAAVLEVSRMTMHRDARSAERIMRNALGVHAAVTMRTS